MEFKHIRGGRYYDPSTNRVFHKSEEANPSAQPVIKAQPVKKEGQGRDSGGNGDSFGTRVERLMQFLQNNLVVALHSKGPANARFDINPPSVKATNLTLPDGYSISGGIIQQGPSLTLEVSSQTGGEAEGFLSIPTSHNIGSIEV